MQSPTGPGPSPMDRDRERSLVERARSQPAAFGELYDFYLPRIYGFVYRRVQDHAVAEELTASTFRTGLEVLRRHELHDDALGAWLYWAAAAATVDHVRHGQRIVSLGMTDGAIGDAFAASLDRDELRAGLARLSGQQREVLTLRFYDDLNADEAAAILGGSRTAFADRLHRAITALHGAVTPGATDAA